MERGEIGGEGGERSGEREREGRGGIWESEGGKVWESELQDSPSLEIT